MGFRDMLNLKVAIYCLFYAVSGVVVSLAAQWQSYQGMNTQAGILVLSTYFGDAMAVAGAFLPRCENRGCKWQQRHPKTEKRVHVVPNADPRPPATFHPKMLYLVVLDIATILVATVGLQVSVMLWTSAYSLVTVLSAIWRKVFLKKNIHPMQWIGVTIIVSGVLSESIWSLLNDLNKKPDNHTTFNATTIFSNSTAPVSPSQSPEENILAIALGA